MLRASFDRAQVARARSNSTIDARAAVAGRRVASSAAIWRTCPSAKPVRIDFQSTVLVMVASSGNADDFLQGAGAGGESDGPRATLERAKFRVSAAEIAAPCPSCVPKRRSHQKRRPRAGGKCPGTRGPQMAGETGFEPATPWSRTSIRMSGSISTQWPWLPCLGHDAGIPSNGYTIYKPC